MNKPPQVQPASLGRRAIARAIDTLVTGAIALALTMVAGFTAAVIALMAWGTGGDDQTGTFNASMVLFLLLALIPVARYEVVATRRRGQTVGKRTAGIQVIKCDDRGALINELPHLELRNSVERWVVPHGAGLFVGVVAGAVAARSIGDYGVLVGVGAWLAVSTIVYLSSLLDENGRGWHDKAAGTIVVAVDEPEQLESGDDPGRSPPPAGQNTTKRKPPSRDP